MAYLDPNPGAVKPVAVKTSTKSANSNVRSLRGGRGGIDLQFARFLEVDPNLRVGALQPDGQIQECWWNFVDDAEGAFWRPYEMPKAKALQWLADTNPEQANARSAKSCLETAMIHLAGVGKRMPDGRKTPKGLIPVLGAYLTIDKATGVIHAKKPDPEDGLTYCVPAEFDWSRVDEAGVYLPREVDPSSKFGQYLEFFFPDLDMRGLLQEAIGASLVTTTREKGWQFVGKGSNGKSTMLHLLRKLHPKAQAVDLKQLSEDKFAMSKIVGATVLISSESVQHIGAASEQKIKEIVSKDLITVREDLGKGYISFIPTCTLYFANNNPIIWIDQSFGRTRKIGLICFNQTMKEGKEKISDYYRQITDDPKELAVVLDWALAGAARVERQNGFTATDTSQAEEEANRLETNPLYAWFCEVECKTDDRWETPKSEIYADYRETLRTRGSQPLAAPKFWVALHDLLEAKFPNVALSERQPSERGRRLERTVNLRIQVTYPPGFTGAMPGSGQAYVWPGAAPLVYTPNELAWTDGTLNFEG